MTNTKQTQDDRTIQPFNRSTIQHIKAYAFTLAETLIVIGIIGVVAALTLPNLNHATGDKETVTRLMKAYSMLNEANDRTVAIYGPLSEWNTNLYNGDSERCWMERMGKFLKISKSCNEYEDEVGGVTCNYYYKNGLITNGIVYVLPDGMAFSSNDSSWCNSYNDFPDADICLIEIYVDVNGSNKGKNKRGEDIFRFMLSDKIGVCPAKDFDWSSNTDDYISKCMELKNDFCSYWVLKYGNLDYLKANENGECNDNPSIILDGVNNTSCH